MSFAKFKIDVDATGHGEVVVNEQDISKSTHAIALFAKVGEPTVLQLFTHAEGAIEGEGIVEVYVDSRQALGQWLTQVNRKAVDERAMNRGQWGDGTTLTDNVIETLLEMINETQPGPHT